MQETAFEVYTVDNYFQTPREQIHLSPYYHWAIVKSSYKSIAPNAPTAIKPTTSIPNLATPAAAFATAGVLVAELEPEVALAPPEPDCAAVGAEAAEVARVPLPLGPMVAVAKPLEAPVGYIIPEEYAAEDLAEVAEAVELLEEVELEQVEEPATLSAMV